MELDPNFAWVYARMGIIYANSGENEKAIEATRKAYELRDRVSEREKLYILEHYYQVVTGEKEQARVVPPRRSLGMCSQRADRGRRRKSMRRN